MRAGGSEGERKPLSDGGREGVMEGDNLDGD